MEVRTGEPEAIVRRVFAPWSILVPSSFSEAYVEEGPYWHAWDDDRSVSLSGFVLDDASGPAPAARIVETLPPPEGEPVDELPAGLLGWGAEIEADPAARASRALSGVLVADGRVLLVTITSDDPEWVHQTWLSIRHDPGAPSFVRAEPS